ncbi:MAG: hypothetical protein JNK60_17745, partial [Acidobacteria bacterium]|nr:hypothetical protein [Acidobacteriota bacterium]
MSEPPRFLCIAVPLFPLAARLRSEPELRTEAAVVCDGNGSGAHVLAGTRLARTAGVTPGMTLAQARTLVPRLLARGRDTEVERAASEALLDAALLFSPRVEKTGEGLVTLDVTGLTRHMRGMCLPVAPPVPGCAP